MRDDELWLWNVTVLATSAHVKLGVAMPQLKSNAQAFSLCLTTSILSISQDVLHHLLRDAA